MRILVLSVLYPKSYNKMSGVFAHHQIRHIVKEGVDVKVVTGIPWAPKPLWFKDKWRAYGESPYERTIDGIHVFYPRYVEMPGAINFSWSGIALYHAVKGLVKQIYQESPFDMIHANTIVPDGYAAVKLAAKYKVPCLCVSRGDLNIYPYYGSMSMKATQHVLRKCNKLITVSKDLSIVAKKLEPRISQDISVVYNGCDFDHFRPANDEEMRGLRKRLGLPQDKIILFLLGALEENKGIFELLEVFNELRKKWGDQIHLLMIGKGKDEVAFKKLIAEKELGNFVDLTGTLPHDEVPNWIKASDIMIFPTHYEGVPNAVLETMACAKPVIATAVGGIPEIIENGKTGYLVQKKDVSGIVQAVNQLIANPVLRQNIGNEGLKFLHTHASWNGNAIKMIKVYQNVIKTFKSKNPGS